MKSVVLLLGVVVCVVLADETHKKMSDFACTDGVKYIENDCNNCFCANGKLACTMMACGAHRDGTTLDCLQNPIFPKAGQECWCFSDAGKICTATGNERPAF